MIVLSWHYILVDNNLRISVLARISLNPMEMFLKLPMSPSRARFRTLDNEKKCLFVELNSYTFSSAFCFFLKEKVIYENYVNFLI